MRRGEGHVYKVQMQNNLGEIVERDYRVGWDPQKVPGHEVAHSCAAQTTVETNKRNQDGTFRVTFAGLSAVLQA